jgi:gluconolactonase
MTIRGLRILLGAIVAVAIPILVLVAFLGPLWAAPAVQPPPDPIAPGATVRRLATGYQFTEGPVADAMGGVYFSDVRASEIYYWTPSDGAMLHRADTGRANGLYFDREGRLVVCEGGNKRLTRDDLSGDVSVITDAYGGSAYNAPNDLWIDASGGIYFSDPNFGGVDTQDGHHVYYVASDGETVSRVTDDLVQPNGVIGTPDGRTLYVTDSSGPTWRYQIAEDGSLSDKTLFFATGGDGMSLDELGNVYIARGVVSIVAPDGSLVDSIQAPESPSNITFGGPEGKTLFITARTSFYAIDMAVRGAYAPEIAGPTATPAAERTPTAAATATPAASATPVATTLPERWRIFAPLVVRRVDG